MEIKTKVLTSPQHLEPSRQETARKNIGAIGKIKVSSDTHVAPSGNTDIADISSYTVPVPDSYGKILKSTGPGEFGWVVPAGIEQQQSDWNQEDDRQVDYIKNKPDIFQGATEDTDGSTGLVPAPVSSEKDKFLRGDGLWADVVNSRECTAAEMDGWIDEVENEGGNNG